MNNKNNQFVIAVYVDNKSGVLTRVTSMFTRRGFNIDALTVGETESPEYSRITITMSGDGYAKEQMINQLRKLFNVKKVEVLEKGDCLDRELMLIKVKNSAEHRQDITSVVDIFGGKIFFDDVFFVHAQTFRVDILVSTIVFQIHLYYFISRCKCFCLNF